MHPQRKSPALTFLPSFNRNLRLSGPGWVEFAGACAGNSLL